MTKEWVQVLLSLQRALLGNVFPALRGVTVEQTGDVRVICYVDGDLTDEGRKTLEEVETEILADFAPAPVTFDVIRRDRPISLDVVGEWVYLRRE